MLNKFFLTSTLLVASIGLASCSNNNESADKKGETDDTIMVWIPGDETEYGFYFDMFENFKQYKEAKGETFNYTIEQQPWSDYWTKLPLEVNQGRGPDMFLAHDAYMDVLIPISQEINLSDETLNSLAIKGLYPGENGKDLFVPTVLVPFVMYANADIVTDYENYPKTWDELSVQALKYTDKANNVIGLDYSQNILMDLNYQNGVTFTSEDGTAYFEDTVFNELIDWQNQGFTDYFTFSNGKPQDSLNEGVAAFIHGETWMEFWAPEEVKGRMKAFPVPSTNGDDDFARIMGEPTFGINKNVTGEKYDTLNELVEFILTDEQTITAIVKGNSGIANNSNITVTYEPFTAGDAAVKTFENRKTLYSIPPSGLEDINRTAMESSLMGDKMETVISNAYTNSKGLSLDRLTKMENEFRDDL